MATGNYRAAPAAARLFIKQGNATAKAVFFLAAVLFALQALICPAPGCASGPAVFVEKTVGGQQTSIVLSGSALPEMRGITFTCTYSVSHASIMNAIVSSPQPATALSVLVDSAASSLSVSIRAASTLLLPDKARILVFKIDNPSTGGLWPLKVVKAVVTDKQGAAVEVPVSTNTAIINYGNRAGGFTAGGDRSEAPSGRAVLIEINGRKVSDVRRSAPGAYVKSIGSANMRGFSTIR